MRIECREEILSNPGLNVHDSLRSMVSTTYGLGQGQTPGKRPPSADAGAHGDLSSSTVG